MDWLKLLKRKASTFWRLSQSDRRLLLQALALFPLVALSLRLWGMKRTQSLLIRWFPARVTPIKRADCSAQVWTTARMVRVAARYNALWANCLKRSLVLWFLLRRQGIESQLRIGVRRQQGKFEAHAWLEWNGVALNDQSDVRQRFAMFNSLSEVVKA